MGTGLLSFVWMLQFAYLAANLYGKGAMPVFSLADTLLLYSWLLITLSIVVHRFFRVELFGFLVNLLGFVILLLPFFLKPDHSVAMQRPLIEDKPLFAHVVLAVAGYAAFAVAAVFSGMYLFLHRQLKGKNWSQAVKRLPSLQAIDSYAGRSVIAGTLLLFASLVIGGARVWAAGDVRLLLDAKVLSSLIVFGAYALDMIRRYSLRVPGIRSAVWNLAAFALVLLNLIVANFSSAFHRWS